MTRFTLVLWKDIPTNIKIIEDDVETRTQILTEINTCFPLEPRYSLRMKRAVVNCETIYIAFPATGRKNDICMLAHVHVNAGIRHNRPRVAAGRETRHHGRFENSDLLMSTPQAHLLKLNSAKC
ncbi:hypothetical protein COEREDRAFT_82144 [Coemansia reversa NRRL 1564]|uniref:Uncharacterized protein n=1 Tax=Coemansia reversa (strain ATCC 12441 / NRRL 1564) TaxID=763665 RepID=A0A2G5B7Y2_COERN|nr:hypothetical protein COEREDRAFT_82144 [Coemansia reversa NRRL 1564]|eukprot:PIA15153.1 hypothetical protein COEREDRAFT_82144 [Coemansia reversa NRRL 1564]